MNLLKGRYDLMKKNSALYWAWGILYAVCAALGFIPEPAGPLAGLLVLVAVAFFLPPALLLHRAISREQVKTVRLIRNLSAASLVATLVALIVNFLSVGASATVGAVLYSVLILVSAPMVCGQSWVIGLFGWALLLTVSRRYLKKGKKA